MTAFVMIVIRKDRPGRVGEPVLMRGDSPSAVQWVKNYKGGKGLSEIGGDDENFAGIGADRKLVIPGKARAGGGERVSRRDNEVERRQNSIEADRRMPLRSVALPGAWSGRREDVFGDFARSYILGRVAKSTKRPMRKVGECG